MSGDRYVANGAGTLGGTYPPAGMAIVTQVDISHQIHPGESTPEETGRAVS